MRSASLTPTTKLQTVEEILERLSSDFQNRTYLRSMSVLQEEPGTG